jgi:predicted NodU family carbamoyl transferase
MGLSAFGRIDPSLLAWLREHFWIRDGSAAVEVSPELSLRWQSSLDLGAIDAGSLRRAKYAPRDVDFTGPPVIDWASRVSPVDIAATGQHFFELLVLRAVKNIRDRTGIEQFALGGGAFLNVLVNEKLRRETEVSPYVPMAPHNTGLSLGVSSNRTSLLATSYSVWFRTSIRTEQLRYRCTFEVFSKSSKRIRPHDLSSR